MGDEKKDHVPYGEPVVLSKPAETKKEGGAGCAAPAVVFIALVLILLLLGVFSRSSSSPQSSSIGGVGNATATAAPVAPHAVIAPTPTIAPMVEVHLHGSICHPEIKVGGAAVVMVDSLRVRKSPGYAGKDDAVDTVHFLDVGSRVNVRGGPETEDNLCWWNVEFQGSSGWSANHSRDGELLLAPTQ